MRFLKTQKMCFLFFIILPTILILIFLVINLVLKYKFYTISLII